MPVHVLRREEAAFLRRTLFVLGGNARPWHHAEFLNIVTYGRREMKSALQNISAVMGEARIRYQSSLRADLKCSLRNTYICERFLPIATQ